jgi:hypothetical protein
MTGSGGTPHGPPDPCIAAGTCAPGAWVDVTPSAVDLSNSYGPGSVEVDPARPTDLYTLFPGLGLWKSVDYGGTWSVLKSDSCNGYLRIPRTGKSPPTMYLPCMDGDLGFTVSLDGGATWTRYPVNVPNTNGQFYAPSVDPYDPEHLIMASHLLDSMVESTDGGRTWQDLPIDPGMVGGTVFALSFIDTGDAKTTRTTFLSESTGYGPGTWRTTDDGAHWTQVLPPATHVAGATQLYQPSPGVVFLAAVTAYEQPANLPGGVYRSADSGATWTLVQSKNDAKVVFGTPNAVYSMYGNQALTQSQCTNGCSQSLAMSAPLPATSGWALLAAQPAATQGPTWATVTNDGTYNIIVTANYGSGLWRYIEPKP